jgi:leucyl aminopeptidase (aminopeptidase T)
VSEPLIRACAGCLQGNLALRSGERVAIVTDATLLPIAIAFESAAREITNDVELIEIPPATRAGEEPPDEAATALEESDVAVAPLGQSISWTRARARATRAGTRIASLPGITEEILLRSHAADYVRIRERVNRLADLLDAGEEVRIRTAGGTALALSIAGRDAHGRKGGLYREPGDWGNLPCGEAFIAPLEGSARGSYLVDASHTGVGRVEAPIRIDVHEGHATAIRGGKEADRLRALLEGAGSRMAFNIAEFGVGCNDSARLGGTTLEDEKVLGTCHVALGSNEFFGGEVRAGVHLDGVIRAPTILIDGETIVKAGKLLADG